MFFINHEVRTGLFMTYSYLDVQNGPFIRVKSSHKPVESMGNPESRFDFKVKSGALSL